MMKSIFLVILIVSGLTIYKQGLDANTKKSINNPWNSDSYCCVFPCSNIIIDDCSGVTIDNLRVKPIQRVILLCYGISLYLIIIYKKYFIPYIFLSIIFITQLHLFF